jgi:hypothetical protein
MKFFALWIYFIACLSVQAAEVSQCGDLQRFDLIPEPWEKYTKTYANGKVRLIYIDTYGEPSYSSAHLLVLIPDNESMIGERKCFVINNGENIGFMSINFAGIVSTYSSRKGSLVKVPVVTYDGVEGIDKIIHVRINYKEGEVSLEK